MAPFDAELFLRLLGERRILTVGATQGSPLDMELLEAARALVAVGAVDLETASEVVDAYSVAWGLRSGRGTARFHGYASPGPAAAADPVRTDFCRATIALAGQEIRVRSVTFTPTVTRLKVLIRRDSAAAYAGRPMGRPRRQMMSVPSFKLADDRGTKATASFSGGGGDEEWDGRLTTDTPLAVDTAWIELDGARIDLSDSATPSPAKIEAVPPADPAHRYLWHWLASLPRPRRPSGLEPVLEALISAGRLEREDPVIEAISAVHESQLHWHPRLQSAPAPVTVDGMAPDWQSFLARPRSRRTAQGYVAAAAITPPFDGITVVIDELTSDVDGWQVDVDISPGLSTGPFDTSPAEVRIAWWAVDDQGQYYLGQLAASHGNADGLSATINFQPGLDRAARSVTLLPTGPTQRARIELPLDWSER